MGEKVYICPASERRVQFVLLSVYLSLTARMLSLITGLVGTIFPLPN